MTKTLWGQLTAYGVASGAALLADMAILWALVHFLSWQPEYAAIISFFVGATIAYIFSVTLAFDEHRLRSRSIEFASFVALGLIGLLLNSLVIYLATKIFLLHYLWAKFIAAGFTFACNFILRRELLFKRRQ